MGLFYLYAALTVIGSYLVGSIPFGYLIGRMHGIDIRTVGSRNIGATNVTRTVGKGAGKLCFFLDFLKGALPVVLAAYVFHFPSWIVLLTALAAILGHVFPVYLKFHGGKGVSTAAGVLIALAPYPLLVAFLVWVIVFFVSRYVSLASIAAAAVLPVVAWIFWYFEWGTVEARSMPTLMFLTVIAVLAIVRHHTNIRRLLDGTESRFGKKN